MKWLAYAVLSTAALDQNDAGSWTTYGKNTSDWRYSELPQIDVSNVAHIAPQWIFQTRVAGNLETTPLVMDGLMYLTGPSNHAFAVDLRTGRQIWHYQKTPPKPLDLCCGEVNRGFAVLRAELFKVNIEDALVALDIKTGKTLWEVELGDYRKGYSGTLAPLVVKDKILVGTAGAEFESAALSTPTMPRRANGCGVFIRSQARASQAARPGAKPTAIFAAGRPGLQELTILNSISLTGARVIQGRIWTAMSVLAPIFIRAA